MLHVLALALTLTTPQQAGQIAQPQSNTTNTVPAVGTSILRGHVFAADTGQPLRKAQVRIFAGEIRENRLTTTDADGAYEFKEVKAGRYTINASKGSYVGLSYGQVKPTDAGKPLQILDNQTVERVDISLPHGSVITGRIVDEYGEPMSDVQIGAQTYQTVQGQRRLVPTGRQAQTNDIGEFRLFGVPPGQYYLTATWRQFNQSAEDKTAYAPMYYPGTDNPGQAQRLTVAVGQQLSDIVMALKPIRATRITGTATTSDGKAMNGSIMMMSTAGYGFNVTNSAPLRDGKFTINGVAPGEYTLRAQTFGPGGMADAETAVLKITATGDDISDLQLVGSKPVSVSGRILIDPAAASSLPVGLMVMPAPVDPGPVFGASPGRIGDDGSFEFKAQPGRMRINVNGAAGWQVRSIRLNGADVADTGIDFKPNEDVSGLEIELTNKLTTVTGMVTNGAGTTLKDYTAIAFAQDKEKWKVQFRYQSIGRPDQDGRFKMSGLVPTDYYIVAIDKFEPSQLTDPDFLDTIRAKATAFTLREGETKTLDLKLNTVQ